MGWIVIDIDLMTAIEIPYSKAMVEEYCGESPWGAVDVLSPLVGQWLEDSGSPWDYNVDRESRVWIYVRDATVALLFKLAWGGT